MKICHFLWLGCIVAKGQASRVFSQPELTCCILQGVRCRPNALSQWPSSLVKCSTDSVATRLCILTSCAPPTRHLRLGPCFSACAWSQHGHSPSTVAGRDLDFRGGAVEVGLLPYLPSFSDFTGSLFLPQKPSAGRRELSKGFCLMAVSQQKCGPSTSPQSSTGHRASEMVKWDNW